MEARLAIFGCGGFGREVYAAARSQGVERIVFVADEPIPPIFSCEVIAPEQLAADDRLVIAIGDSAARMSVSQRLSHATWGEVRAASCEIGPEVEIGVGAVFCGKTIVTASARIGRHFQCNIYSYVAHDCEIGDYVTFAPKVCCNGNVKIGDGAYVGTAATLRQGVSIGAGAVIGMGAVVTKDVAPGVTVVGNPAKQLVR